MNDHHLDDLIIGDPEPGSNRSKTLLTIIALLIVVLIIGLILWALLFNSPADDDSISGNTTTQQTKPLAPDLIPLDNSNNEVTISKPKPVAKTTPEQKPVSATPKPKPAVTTTKPATPAQKPKPADQQPVTQPAKTKPTETKEAESKPAEAAIIKNKNKTIYYVQVGAFKRDPSPKFIKKLKDNGFTFITKTSKDIRRVRVGPYDSYQEAKAALPGIKTKLGVDGLIVKY